MGFSSFLVGLCLAPVLGVVFQAGWGVCNVYYLQASLQRLFVALSRFKGTLAHTLVREGPSYPETAYGLHSYIVQTHKATNTFF